MILKVIAFANNIVVCIESDPKCQCSYANTTVAVEENSAIGFTCSVNFSGNWAPIMTWRRFGEPFSVISVGVVNKTITNKSVTYRLTINVTNDVHGDQIASTTFFSLSNKPLNTSAIDIPVYRYEWISPKINVKGFESKYKS